MPTSSLFAARFPRDVTDLIEQYPLAWLVSAGTDAPLATPLPLLAELGAKDEPITLIGHMARGNPHLDVLKSAPRALAIFTGPHGYISPSWMQDRTQAPTWNFAAVHCVVDVSFDPRPAFAAEVLEALVCRLETGRADAWSTSDMGTRYERLMHGVIGFRANFVEIREKFKLGQNERDEVYTDILVGISRTEPTLADWMRKVNAHRTLVAPLSSADNPMTNTNATPNRSKSLQEFRP